MICTEKEAESEWCPMVQAAKFEDFEAANNREGVNHCCGSMCMWWEWSCGDPADNDNYNGSRQGYCGRVGHRPVFIVEPNLGLKP